MQKTFSDHRHYVQGVAWDPLGELFISESTDRTMRVHGLRASKARSRAAASDFQMAADFVQLTSVYKRPLKEQERNCSRGSERLAQQGCGKIDLQVCGHGQQRDDNQVKKDAVLQNAIGNTGGEANDKTEGGKGTGKKRCACYVFQDEGLNTFVRRLSFSPEGSFAVAPAATLGPSGPASRCLSLEILAISKSLLTNNVHFLSSSHSCQYSTYLDLRGAQSSTALSSSSIDIVCSFPESLHFGHHVRTF
jgi:hypothetical protein